MRSSGKAVANSSLFILHFSLNNMKILVLNCGSSSIKYALYNMDDKSVMTSGGAERVGLEGSFVKVKLSNGEKRQIMHNIPEHTEGVIESS